MTAEDQSQESISPTQEAATPVINEERPIPVRPVVFEKPVELISWESLERPAAGKDKGWFAVLALISIFTCLVLLALGQWSLGLLMLSLGFALYAIKRVQPPMAHFTIYTNGMRVRTRFYPSHDLLYFWISEVAGAKVLYIRTDLNFPHLLTSVVSAEKVDAIEEALLHYLPYFEAPERDWTLYLEQLLDLIAPYLPEQVGRLVNKLDSKLTQSSLPKP